MRHGVIGEKGDESAHKSGETKGCLLGAVNKRLREELAKLQVEINEEKSRIVDLDRAESFGFLGFDFRRLRSMKRQVWRAHYTPKIKKRTALLRKLKEVFRRYQSQPVDRVVQLINPVLRGWVNYFAVGHSSECFSFIKDWVEKKIRRHMGSSRNRRGFGWKRWSRRWLYEELKLFNGYRIRRSRRPKHSQQDRSHNPWREASRKAQCGKTARCV